MKDSFLIKKGRFTPFAVIAMILLPTVTGILCMCFGRMKLPVSDVIGSICSIFTGEIDNLQTLSRCKFETSPYPYGNHCRCRTNLRRGYISVPLFQSTRYSGYLRRNERHLRWCDFSDYFILRHLRDTVNRTCLRTDIGLFYTENRRKE